MLPYRKLSPEAVADGMTAYGVQYSPYFYSLKWIGSNPRVRPRFVTAEEPLRVSLYHQGHVKVLVM